MIELDIQHSGDSGTQGLATSYLVETHRKLQPPDLLLFFNSIRRRPWLWFARHESSKT